MMCPRCANELPANASHCNRCGFYLPVPQVLPVRKKKKWVPFLVVFLSLAYLALVVWGGYSLYQSMQPASPTPWFYTEGNTLYFDQSQYPGGEELEIPDYVDGIQVLHISQGCFVGMEALTTVILPDQLQSIGDQAFADCPNLRGIFLPESVRSLGSEAFLGCSSLEAICLTGNIQSIGQGAFDGCESLKYVIFAGPYALWQSLYPWEINENMEIHCNDGTFFHSQTP